MLERSKNCRVVWSVGYGTDSPHRKFTLEPVPVHIGNLQEIQILCFEDIPYFVCIGNRMIFESIIHITNDGRRPEFVIE